MSTTAEITYLRAGRSVRSKGRIIETNPSTGLFKVKPSRRTWKTVWISAREIQQGGSQSAAPRQPAHHIGAVNKMVAGLQELLDRKGDAA